MCHIHVTYRGIFYVWPGALRQHVTGVGSVGQQQQKYFCFKLYEKDQQGILSKVHYSEFLVWIPLPVEQNAIWARSFFKAPALECFWCVGFHKILTLWSLSHQAAATEWD